MGERGMGRIFQPMYKNKHGKWGRTATWWIAYYHNGRELRESSRSTNKNDARRLLRVFAVSKNGTDLDNKLRDTLGVFGRGRAPCQTPGLDSPHQPARSWSWQLHGGANHGHQCCQTDPKSHPS